MSDLWIKREGGALVCSAEPFDGAVRYVATGKPWSRAAEDDRLVAAFEAGTHASYLSDNPYVEGSERWFAWRAGYYL